MNQPVFQSEREFWQREDGMTVISRRVFCRDYFNYSHGDHVVYGGPTTNGKTTLAFDCLEYVATPDFPVYIAVSKPRDPVTEKRGRELGYRFVREWPPPKKWGEILGGEKPKGYVVWPQFGNLQTDMEECARLTSTLLMDRYSQGARNRKSGGILMMDDTMVKAKIMGLDKDMVTILAMAGAMKLSLWIFIQRPNDSGRTAVWGYENAKHLFFTKGGDRRMMLRYVEIIGEHGDIARKVIPTLGHFQFLYVHKTEGWMCIVDAGPER